MKNEFNILLKYILIFSSIFYDLVFTKNIYFFFNFNVNLLD